MAIITLKDITMIYGDQRVLDRINLYIDEGEFLTLLGPSGCGKTTTLRILGGFTAPTEGEIRFEDHPITGLPAYKRQINTVFQNYALFPHMDIYENIAFGLRIRRRPEADIRRKVGEMLRLVSLKGFERRTVDSLSGGQKQRVAIARALVNEPKVLLLDEPLGALDLKLRKDMQLELKKIQQEVGITFVYVTHDQEEALTMSDTIVVMDRGRIQQIGTPTDIYNEPKNTFVADFIGESNILDGSMPEDGRVVFAGRSFPCVDAGFDPGEAVDVVVRPEDIELTAEGAGQLEGLIESVIFKGVHYEVLVRENGREWTIHTTRRFEAGRRAGLLIGPDDIHIMKKVS